MALVPLSYNVRSLFVRWSATLLTVLGIGATVAVVAGVLALQAGFARLFSESGRDDLVVFLRPGANNEGDSSFTRERAQILIKSRPEIATDASSAPLASMECYAAVRRNRLGGGETNVPIRGIEQRSLDLNAGHVSLLEGRWFAPGNDEVTVGRNISEKFQDCKVGDVVVFNTTPFKVVGVFDSAGPFASEVWGDLDRILEALERPGANRVIARLKPGVDLAEFRTALEKDQQTPAKVLTEREYLTSQTKALSFMLIGLGVALGLIMGIAAIMTATNTMLAALAARTHEIGVLLSIGFRPFSVFLSFLFEATVLGLLGGLAGCVMVLPINGIETSTTNFQTFTDVSFGFRVTPDLLVISVLFSLVLGVCGGAWPAFRAAMMKPTEALRRR